MSLTRDDLPAFADVVRAAGALSPAQRSSLREIVEHVYLAGRHGFKGIGPGYLGIATTSGQAPDAETAVVVQSRVIGYDAYRVLQLGDAIMAVALIDTRADSMQPISDIESLRQLLRATKPGDSIIARVHRNGADRDVSIRLGPMPERAVAPNTVIITHLDEAERYWTKTFLPRLKVDAATKPAA